MPPVKKVKKQPQTIDSPEEENAAAGTEEQLAISGQLDKKMKKSQSRINRQRGVVVIRHLPHGFFEEQLQNYFQQFGKVTRVRLARSTRTGGSKGFAFVEFEFPEVAQVAAETMDNYLMFQKVVKAQYIPPEAQQYNYFKTSVRKVLNKVGKPIYVSGKTASIQKKALEYNNWTDEAYQKRIGSNLRKLNKLKKKYAHLGIDFDNFTVKPNIQTVDEKAKQKKSAANVSSDDVETTPAPGSILLLKKRKQSEDKKENTAKKSKNPKALELKDLLENTLNDEDSSEDEEFVPIHADADEDDEDVSTSDEEDYGLEKDAKEEKPTVLKKSAKPSKIDRVAELLKRKPNAGGIQKLNKNLKEKKSKKPNSVIKKSLKVEAANDIKKLGNMKQMKKIDFGKSNKKKKRV